MFIGTKLNASEDALNFGSYSDCWINTFMARHNTPLWSITETEMKRDLQVTLEKHLASLGTSLQLWGWKEPRSIYLLPFFHGQFHRLKFLHVVRDGRDMALSSNQNQLRKHGDTLLGPEEAHWSQPLRSIALWSRVNLRAADYGEKYLRDQYLLIRFEDLCAEPIPTIRCVFDFFGLKGDVSEIARLEVRPPSSLGRWQNQGQELQEALHRIGRTALRKFGYRVPG
jgi:hypothetical protein